MQPTLTLLTALLLLPLAALNAAEFHVASSGNGANPGTKDQPFLTLELVREATCQLKATGPLKKPVTVVVRGGTYRLQAGLIPGTPDTGTEAAPVVWQAASGEEVRLCWRCVAIRRRVRSCYRRRRYRRVGSAARGKVLQTDLASIGTKELGSFPDLFPRCAGGARAVLQRPAHDARPLAQRGLGDHRQDHRQPARASPAGDKSGRPGIFEYAGDRPARWNVAGRRLASGLLVLRLVRRVDPGQGHRPRASGRSPWPTRRLRRQAGQPSPRRYRP